MLATPNLRGVTNDSFNGNLWFQFETWRQKFHRIYDTHDELDRRFEIFRDNFNFIRAHNSNQYNSTTAYMLGLNAFSDLSNKEFKARFTPFGSLNSDKTNCKPQIASDETNVKEIDWQTLGAVTPVKDQGQCGSCWSFSATGAIEGAVYNSNEGKSKSLQSFSEQQLVDCSKMYGNLGCNGGLMDNAFKYVIDNGICTETAYPYTATSSITETCKSKSCVPNKSVCECVDVIPSSTKDLMRAVSITPVSVAIQADATTFQMYKSGVYTDIKCGTDLNHGVLVVGYGVDTESQLPYWRVKNSWGTDWGDEGYIKILRSEGDGICGIAMQPSYVQTC